MRGGRWGGGGGGGGGWGGGGGGGGISILSVSRGRIRAQGCDSNPRRAHKTSDKGECPVADNGQGKETSD